MMDYIKSKFSGNAKYIFILIFIFLPYGIYIVVKSLINFNHNYEIFFILLFTLFLKLGISTLSNIKLIYIYPTKLKYYSIMVPFGKTIYFSDCIGKFYTSEYGAAGEYKVLYLVNKDSYTFFRIMGLHYSNFDEMDKHISIPILKYNLSGNNYFKLLLTDIKINLSKNKTKNVDFNYSKYLKYLIIFVFIIFILNMLFRIIIKISS